MKTETIFLIGNLLFFLGFTFILGIFFGYMGVPSLLGYFNVLLVIVGIAFIEAGFYNLIKNKEKQ